MPPPLFSEEGMRIQRGGDAYSARRGCVILCRVDRGLEHDIKALAHRAGTDREFAIGPHRVLCNADWRHHDGADWSCTGRLASKSDLNRRESERRGTAGYVLLARDSDIHARRRVRRLRTGGTRRT